MNRDKATRLSNHIFAIVILTAFIFAAAGCVSLQKQPVKMPTISTEMMTTPALVSEADKAWRTKDYITSELFYTRLLERTDIPERVILPATERLAVSSFKSGHYHEAEARLEQWQKLSEDAISSPVWQGYYYDTLAAIKDLPKLRTIFPRLWKTPSCLGKSAPQQVNDCLP